MSTCSKENPERRNSKGLSRRSFLELTTATGLAATGGLVTRTQ